MLHEEENRNNDGKLNFKVDNSVGKTSPEQVNRNQSEKENFSDGLQGKVKEQEIQK